MVDFSVTLLTMGPVFENYTLSMTSTALGVPEAALSSNWDVVLSCYCLSIPDTFIAITGSALTVQTRSFF